MMAHCGSDRAQGAVEGKWVDRSEYCAEPAGLSDYKAVGFMVGVGLHPLPTVLYPCRNPQGMGVGANILGEVRFVVVASMVVVVVN